MGWIDRQLPIGDEMFLDHVGFFVSDLAAAAGQMARLGFQVSPLNVQYNLNAPGSLVVTGTSNRLVKLERGFLEMLGATAETPLADQLRQALGRYQGLHLIALSHADLDAERVRMAAAGFKMQEIVKLRRTVHAAGGERELAFSVLRTEPGEMAEGRVQFSYCHTPELQWPTVSTDHPNRAQALTDVLVCVEDVGEAADRYGRFTARPPSGGYGLRVVPLERGRIVLVDVDVARRILPGLTIPSLPFMAGVSLRSADLGVTRAVLAQAGVEPVAARDDLVCVGPADALGAYVLFHAASVERPWEDLALRIGND